jgi:hypothetical protein
MTNVLADDRAAAQRCEADGRRPGARRCGRRAIARRPLVGERRHGQPPPLRPSSSAVPEGASTLWRWCISTISMSNSGRIERACATLLHQRGEQVDAQGSYCRT